MPLYGAYCETAAANHEVSTKLETSPQGFVGGVAHVSELLQHKRSFEDHLSFEDGDYATDQFLGQMLCVRVRRSTDERVARGARPV